jgi:hypothetical protein
MVHFVPVSPRSEGTLLNGVVKVPSPFTTPHASRHYFYNGGASHCLPINSKQSRKISSVNLSVIYVNVPTGQALVVNLAY